MTDQIPLFDSHGGATLDGAWLDGRPGLGFAELRRQLTDAGFLGGLVQALPGMGGYEHRRFANAALEHDRLFPVAAWDGSAGESTAAHLAGLKAMGFVGVHVHPRSTGVGPDTAAFRTLLQAAGEAGLPVFYCTYQFAAVEAGLPVDPLPHLATALREAPRTRLVLLHGGTVELLRYAEFTRANPRVLLDLSFTILRYAGTSLDADLGHVLRTLDRRVCIGSDAPEYSPGDLRTRFEALTSNLPTDKRLNIAGRSLARFLGLDLYRRGIDMDADEKEANRERYEARHAEFGYDERTLGWTKGRHKLRYEMLLSSWPSQTRSVLDVGCGFGDMAAYCRESGRGDWRYTGIDIVPALIAEGQARYPDADLRLHDMDVQGLPQGYDVIVASGVFSYRLKDNLAFVERAFEAFAGAAKVGFAANFMSPVADIRYDDLFYPDPAQIFDVARRHSRRILLRHDYMPFEYTVQVFMDDAFSPDSVVFEPYEGLIDRSR